MMSLTRRLGGPVVATGLALALGIISGVPAQAASATGWQRVYRNSSTTQNILYGMAALSGTDQWAVGDWGNSALVMHGNGSTWRRVSVPGQAGANLFQVTGTSPGNVWAFGNRDGGSVGVILRYNGSSWQSVAPPAGLVPNEAAVLSSTDVWIGGTESCTGSGSSETCQTPMYQWDGAQWNGPYQVPAVVNWISGSGASNVWLTGEAGTGLPGPYTLVTYRWTGSRWAEVSMPRPRSEGPPVITVTSRRNVWLFAWQAKKSRRGYLLHWTGSSWREYVAPANLPAEDGLVTDGSGGVWAGALVHFTGGRWVDTVPGPAFVGGGNGFALRGLARVPGRSTLWAGGQVSRTPASSVWDSLIARYP